MNYFMGIDIGSQSTKGVICDENGSIIAAESISHIMENNIPGHFEQDADKVWWGEFCEISKKLIAKSGLNSKDIKAVGHSATSPCVLFLDENNKPLRKGILYGIDTRAHVECEELSNIIGEENLINTGGCGLTSQSVAPKIVWLRKNEPHVWEKTRKILSAMGYVTYKLTGLYTQNTYDAVAYTALFDIFKKKWIDDYSKHITDMEYLPDLVSPSEFVGIITKEASSETWLIEGTKVLPGIADAAGEAVGAGVSKIGQMMLMLGTSSFYILLTDKLHKTTKFWPSNFLHENEYVITGGTSNCGSTIVWFMETFMKDCETDPYDKLLSEMNDYEVHESLPIVVPYLAGERTPIHDAKAKAIIFNLSINHTRADIYKSLLEGIAYTIKHNVEEIKKLSAIENIFAIGGGIKNPVLMPLIANACEMPVVIPSVGIGASFGDAFLAAKAYGSKSELSDWVHAKETIVPKSENFSLMRKRYNTFRKLYENTKNMFDR